MNHKFHYCTKLYLFVGKLKLYVFKYLHIVRRYTEKLDVGSTRKTRYNRWTLFVLLLFLVTTSSVDVNEQSPDHYDEPSNQK